MTTTTQYANNAGSTLSAAITATATTVPVASGTGVLFPTITTGQFFYATLATASTTSVTVYEIVQVTATGTDSFTVVRAANGTTASAFVLGDKFELRITQANLANFEAKVDASTLATSLGNIPTSGRQTVQLGVVNSSGYANMLSAGTGLALNLAATAQPMRTAFSQGASDYISTLSADAVGVISVFANNASFIAQDYVTATSVTWSNTLAQKQEGNLYNQATQSVLQFGGSSGSTAFLDDFGNTWTAQGGAKVQTNQIKFGTGALGGSGTNNALNGTSDFIQSTGFTSYGSGSWTERGYFYATAIASTSQFFGAFNASGYGIALGMANDTNKTQLFLSSTGTSWDIASGTRGTTAISLNAWHRWELTYDSYAGKYFLYIDGVADITVSINSKICSISTKTHGKASTAGNLYYLTGYMDKLEFLSYSANPNGITYTVPIAAPNVATQGYASDWYSTSNTTMYQVTSASTAAGSNPTFAAKNRVYVGEVFAGASAISSVVNYALLGKYKSFLSTPLPAASALISFAHNIGGNTKPAVLTLVNLTAQGDCTPGTETNSVVTVDGNNTGFPLFLTRFRSSAFIRLASTIAFRMPAGSANIDLIAANWGYRVVIERE